MLSKSGGMVAKILCKAGFKLEGALFKVETTGDTIRLYLDQIDLGQLGKLGGLVYIHQVAWINNNLQIDFSEKSSILTSTTLS